MSDLDIPDLKAKALAATPGPWRACKEGECSCKMVWSLPGDFPIFTGRSDDTSKKYVGETHTLMADEYPDLVYASIPEHEARTNAAFIAAANPQAILALIAERDAALALAPHHTSWRCFYCDDVFIDREAAKEHFGTETLCDPKPACCIDVAHVREMEEQLARYRAEDSDADRQFHAMRADHAQALIREEEKGYAKGMTDARNAALTDAVDALAGAGADDWMIEIVFGLKEKGK